MENLKEKMPIIIVMIVVLVICAGLIYLGEYKQFYYYTKIDNTKIEKVSATDNMKYEYKLTAYNENGNKKEITFKTSRELRNEAYLRLNVNVITGVNKWEEVQYEELPEKVQKVYSEE